MPIARKTLLAGIAVAAVVGTCGLALAHGPAEHMMTVQLPDGGIARIEYTGKTAPKVTFGANPLAVSFFGPTSPFAQLQRISDEMNREMATIMRGSAMTPSPLFDSAPLFEAGLRKLPAHMHQFSMVSSMSGNGVCMQSMQITQNGHAKPKVVSHSSGDCNGTNAAVFGAAPPSGHMPMAIGTWKRLPSHNAPGPALHEAAYQPPD